MMLTPEQRRLYAHIRALSAKHGRRPTYREIAESLGTSAHGHVYDMVRRLIERGVLRRERRGWSFIPEEIAGAVFIFNDETKQLEPYRVEQ